MWSSHNGVIISDQEAAALAQQPPFLSGRSLIETMRCRRRQIYLGKYHWQRLFAGMTSLDYRAPRHCNITFLKAHIANLVYFNQMEAGARVRLQLAPHEDPTDAPHFLITVAPLPESGAPLQAGIAQNVYKQPHFLSHLKTGDRQLYALAALTAAHHGWDEALICNEAGRVIESTIANIFWVEGKKIFTPPLSEGCVAGVMRAFLLEKLPGAGYEVCQEPLTSERLGKADEIFLSNALRGLRPVAHITGMKHYDDYFCKQFSKNIIKQ